MRKEKKKKTRLASSGTYGALTVPHAHPARKIAFRALVLYLKVWEGG